VGWILPTKARTPDGGHEKGAARVERAAPSVLIRRHATPAIDL